MQKVIRLLACSGLMLSCAAHAGDTLPGLSSPMINRGIYRDGEVQRLKGHFGDWTVTCDEIVSLKQRFCSLRSVALRNDNRRAAVVDLSTGDNGRPAALVHLPLGVSVGYGVDVETGSRSPPAPGAPDEGPASRASSVSCPVPRRSALRSGASTPATSRR